MKHVHFGIFLQRTVGENMVISVIAFADSAQGQVTRTSRRPFDSKMVDVWWHTG